MGTHLRTYIEEHEHSQFKDFGRARPGYTHRICFRIYEKKALSTWIFVLFFYLLSVTSGHMGATKNSRCRQKTNHLQRKSSFPSPVPTVRARRQAALACAKFVGTIKTHARTYTLRRHTARTQGLAQEQEPGEGGVAYRSQARRDCSSQRSGGYSPLAELAHQSEGKPFSIRL